MKFIAEYIKTSKIEIEANSKAEALDKALAVSIMDMEKNVVDGWYFNTIQEKE